MSELSDRITEQETRINKRTLHMLEHGQQIIDCRRLITEAALERDRKAVKQFLKAVLVAGIIGLLFYVEIWVFLTQ